MPEPAQPAPLAPRMFPPISPAHPLLPLQGLTLLAVEDSRYAAEALRLICQRSGARLRRAESVEAARAHLRVYRPDVVIVDLSLPDEPGTDLITELAFGTPDHPRYGGIVLACSGDPTNRAAALEAGAADFLDKPLDSLASFQSAILCHLPNQSAASRTASQAPLIPDHQALHDDLHRAIDLLKLPDQHGYAEDFLHSLARSTHDLVLEEATRAARADLGARQRLTRMLAHRLQNAPSPFAPGALQSLW